MLQILSIFFYLAATLLLVQRLRGGPQPGPRLRPLALGLAFLGVLGHGVSVYQAIAIPAGLDLEFFNVLSLIALFITLLLVAAATTRPLENLGIPILPLAAVALLLQMAGSGPPDLVSDSIGVQLHILLSILAYALLSLAAVQALLLAIQDHYLRSRQPAGFIRALPPLETMESLLFQMIGAGFLLLTAALISGVHFIDDIFAQHLVHKTTLSIVAWAVFAGLLAGRWRFGWRGRKAIRWTLTGIAVLAAAYLGSKLVLELILHR